MVFRARPVDITRDHTGRLAHLADGSIWRETVSGWWLIRAPRWCDTPELRALLRERWPSCAAAYAPPHGDWRNSAAVSPGGRGVSNGRQDCPGAP